VAPGRLRLRGAYGDAGQFAEQLTSASGGKPEPDGQRHDQAQGLSHRLGSAGGVVAHDLFVLRPRVSRRAFFHWPLVTNPSPGMVLRAQPLG
jgi:hypothetical protein